MSVINTNYLALVSQNNLTKSQNALGTAIERLSSGMRINSAKDDAAGQAIANRFTANIKGLTQAGRNANDGISIAQTTEGALNEINTNLQRIRELSVQAATGSNSDSDLKSIQAEITQRLDEINRVSEQTQFNGVRVLASDNSLRVQVGANDHEAIDIGLKEITASTLGLNGFKVTGDQEATLADLKSRGATGVLNYSMGGTAYEVDFATGAVTDGANAPQYVSAATGKIIATQTNESVNADADFAEAFATAAGTSVGVKDITVNGVKWSGEVTDANGQGTFSATIEGKKVTIEIVNTAATPATATLNISGAALRMDTATYDATSRFTTQASNAAATETDLVRAGAQYQGSTALTIAAGNNGAGTYTVDSNNTILSAGGEAMYVKGAGTSSETLVAQSDASLSTFKPLEKLDQALAQVDALRGELGAVQNRFQSTIANLSNTVNNLSAARSRIEDADYAVEVSNMTRAQILQQAGTSVLAQANQVPQTVLSLLR